MTIKSRTWFSAASLLVAAAVVIPPPVSAGDGSSGTGVDYRLPDSQAISALASTSSFVDWYRYPAEERAWLRQTGATAYTRDVLAGGETFVSGASDGEYWHATAQKPDGSTLTWGNIQFYADFSGQTNCFVSPFWAICGTTSIYILWYSEAQCQKDGDWTMNFFANGSQFHTGQYELLPQIPPDKVPLYNQGAYTDAYDSICRTGTQNNVYPCDGRPNEVTYTIQAKGCWTTSAAMILSYHGVATNPAALNTWLTDNSGYDRRGHVIWDGIARYADSLGETVAVLGAGGNLDTAVCTYGPHIIGVNSDHHWVATTGQDENKTTRLINDPDGGVATTLAAGYGNSFGGIRRFGGPEYTYTDITGIVIRFHSPGELLVADPLGRLTGFDPTTGVSYNQIPGSSYNIIGLANDVDGDPGPPTHDLDIRRPLAGEYQIDVIGTGTGTYDLEVHAVDPELNPSQAVFTDVPIVAGDVHSYTVDYAKQVGADLGAGGGFDGGGQRPRDVNKFLSYGSPVQTRTALPAATASYSVLVFYSDSILPSTFTAILNGVDVTSWFAASPGAAQSVDIPLEVGQNVLKLSVSGQLPNRVATDSDRLVFLVP